ncbi:MAG: LysE family transporter [Clostridium sp.]|uniref:LysE/ArgO family amino acid transporter n=1 Tax=Clostridium sp. TaxID=1506 RepID=UPI0025C4A631|nr:LysE family transporter [Clostridium sp.]MCH3963752.1 LysE family transporter [Clostridium sp.]MCI1714893.1 LysE family transporter [Clostridium sp.]MCI1798918.1 LysE family transporter [Clostridium sp.]MCI1813076.1 LysE family transporter [Clostridium sp.]MCI1869966.1 LysE family transporter [Clostridium sp.]
MSVENFFHGLILGFAYTAPIGMQNMYVINSALNNRRLRACMTAAAIVFFDCSLAIACFFGIGSIIERSIYVKLIILFAGSIAVVCIGIKLIMDKSTCIKGKYTDDNFTKIVIASFVVTWMNPQAIIDGSLLLGGFRSSLALYDANFFIMGVCAASIIWFFMLTTVVSTFKYRFNKKIIRFINVVCGSIIILYGLKLGVSFISMAEYSIPAIFIYLV